MGDLDREGPGAGIREAIPGILLGSREGDYFQLYDNGKPTHDLDRVAATHTSSWASSRLFPFGVPGRCTAISMGDAGCNLQDLETGRTRAVLTGQEELSGAFTSRRQAVRDAVAASRQREVNVWEVESGKLLRSVPLHLTYI